MTDYISIYIAMLAFVSTCNIETWSVSRLFVSIWKTCTNCNVLNINFILNSNALGRALALTNQKRFNFLEVLW